MSPKYFSGSDIKHFICFADWRTQYCWSCFSSCGECVEQQPSLLQRLVNSKVLPSWVETVAGTKQDQFRFALDFRQLCRHVLCVSIAARARVQMYVTHVQ